VTSRNAARAAIPEHVNAPKDHHAGLIQGHHGSTLNIPTEKCPASTACTFFSSLGVNPLLHDRGYVPSGGETHRFIADPDPGGTKEAIETDHHEYGSLKQDVQASRLGAGGRRL
jgi:hypothetical protein